MRRTRALTTTVTVALVLGVTAVSAAAAALRMPAAGAVVEAFAPPPGPYGAGHRGVDVDVPAPGAVVAAGSGTVVFAGTVAGARWVTLDHGDGLLTSYGELAGVEVRSGDVILGGDRLGSVGGAHGQPGRLHWSARRDGAYIDPLRLVEETPWVPTLVGPGGWSAGDVPDVPRYDPWDGTHRFGLVPGSPRATSPGYSLPPNPNHVVAIAGLGSRTGEPPLDLGHLGYGAADVTELSYAGRVEDATTARGGDQRPYGPEDTWAGVEAAALRLRDQLRAQWARSPGQAVDLVGHSMGGVVALYYLLALHDPADPTLPPVAHVATIASPLEGADLAGALVDARGDARATLVLAAIGALIDDHDPFARAVADLAPGSGITTTIGDGWAAATLDPFTSPLATGTRILTIGGEVDLVVPEHRSDLPGADHVVLPGSHDGVRETEAARIVLREFLADAPVPGEPGGLGHLVSHPLGWLERQVPGWLLPG